MHDEKSNDCQPSTRFHCSHESPVKYAIGFGPLPDDAPRLIWGIGGHLLCDTGGLIAKIFLIDHAFLGDEKCHNTAGAIIRRIGDKAEAIAGWEHAVVIAMIGSAVAGRVVAFGGSLGKHWPGRAFGLAFLRFPIKSILFAGLADKPDRIRACRFSVVGGGSVVALRGDDT